VIQATQGIRGRRNDVSIVLSNHPKLFELFSTELFQAFERVRVYIVVFETEPAPLNFESSKRIQRVVVPKEFGIQILRKAARVHSAFQFFEIRNRSRWDYYLIFVRSVGQSIFQ